MAKQLEDYMQWPEIEALMYAECGRPETVLGPKQVDKSHVLITAFEPEADSIVVSGEDLKKEYKMTKMDETGYFAVLIQAKKIPSYHFVLKQGKKKIEKTDAYAVDSLFDGVDMTQFSNGIHDTVYEKMGAHPMTIEGVKGTYFAVWAPEAKAVSVVGDFNDWQAARNPMRYLEAAGIYELFVPGVSAGDLYKYEIWGADGKRVMKADPYGNYAEHRPATEEDIAKIEHLGVRTVIDLRFPSETKELPDRLGQDMDYINCSLMGTTKLEQLDIVNSSVVETKTLHRMYRLMLRNGGKEIKKALEVVADSEGAVLFHCAAGKDRTGILAMLILSSVGVEREDILVDYQCSSTYITKFTTDISGSNIYNMKWILNWIDQEWGGVPEYLRQIGVQSETIQKIKSKFVENLYM